MYLLFLPAAAVLQQQFGIQRTKMMMMMIRALQMGKGQPPPFLSAGKQFERIFHNKHCATALHKPSLPLLCLSKSDLCAAATITTTSATNSSTASATKTFSSLLNPFNFKGRRTYANAQAGPTTSATGTAHQRVANRLIDEKSPYLLQHAYNPVNW